MTVPAETPAPGGALSEADAAAAQAQAQIEVDSQAWRDAVAKASTIADIKAVLLGTNTPVRPVVDRRP